MRLSMGSSYFISDIGAADASAFVEHLREKQIYDQTLNIPYPYTDADAEGWIRLVAKETEQRGQSVNWAVRRGDGYLIGGIGFHGLEERNRHRAEIGYWLAKSYWNQGIMTDAVKAVTQYGFEKLGLVRVTALVFHFNGGSARVLEKSGYQYEGRLRQHYEKDGNIFDGLLFAAVRETVTRT
jgi:[ribosomal protein S5]-alanine N-acetyltransferase